MRLCKVVCLVALTATVGCTGDIWLYGAESIPVEIISDTELELGIAVVHPVGVETVAAGAMATVQWADIASVAGTGVRVQAQRNATTGNTTLPDAPTGPVIFLIGDATPGTGRDAIADGENDIFHWDTTGVRVGRYIITMTIEAPDGTSETVMSLDPDRGTTGVVNITTTLPVPTLNFTAPGATDETVTTGNTFNITWTDNGSANADARMTLGLDPDDNPDNGNEVILLSNEPLSTDGNNGSFTFNFLDQDGNGVADGTYTVFAQLDDNANDVVTVEATGQLILNP
ncbi:MAG TPA: hypothetical protein VJZ71_05395 [Phycisphaerae bacterium]|nr:hypothetical protein [Phycisphaerae bacterium]